MTARATGFAISSEQSIDDDDEEPSWSGHGKKIPFNEADAYSMGVQVQVIPEEQLDEFKIDKNYKPLRKMSRNESKESLQSAATEETNEQFAETEVIGIVSIDRAGTVLFSNSKAQEIFQFPNLTGGSIHDFVPNNYFGTDKFQALHNVMVKSFFDKPFAGGRMLDPGTILRAKLPSGKLCPLNVGLEAKLDPHTGRPRLVIGYITEAAQLIDQSKVEKMLSRATLVILQQFISQAILSAVGFWELVGVPPLRYPSNVDDDTVILESCKDYTFNKLTLDGDQGDEDYKMMLYVISTATTILISVLPLFVNHMNDRSVDEADIARHKKSFSRQFKDFANWINDAQEYLSTIRAFRSLDIVNITTIVCTTNLFLLYELKSLPNEYEITNLKDCEQMAKDEINLSISMCILGALPLIYFILKTTYKWLVNGCQIAKFKCCNKTKVQPTYGSHASLYNPRTKFKSKASSASMNMGSNPASARSDNVVDYATRGGVESSISIEEEEIEV